MDVLPGLSGNRFDHASQVVVRFLKTEIPHGFWSVTRYDGASQVYLTTADDVYGLQTGDGVAWADSFCQHVVSGQTPEVSPDAMSEPLYAQSEVARALGIGSYVGVPIRHSDGALFGTLCGIDPQRQPDTLSEQTGLLHVLSALLTAVLEADLQITAAARAVEMAELRADTDAMTGLLNRRGWDRFIELEDERYRRYGDAGAVLVLDLDGLKAVNDTQGHAAGDDYIRRAAGVITLTARASDVVARLGGDEFGVIATHATDETAAALQHRLETEFAAAGIGCSIGRAQLSIKTGFVDAWHRADEVMYAIKSRRRLHLVS